jgi:hypothetical protein
MAREPICRAFATRGGVIIGSLRERRETGRGPQATGGPTGGAAYLFTMC